MTTIVSRRRFLARCGALGAMTVAMQLPGSARARAGTPLGPASDQVAEVLRLLAFDTMAGLVAFAVPGPDLYSRAQGMTTRSLGGVDALAPDAMIEAFDRFLPMPDSMVRALTASLATATSDIPFSELDPVIAAASAHASTLDEGLHALTANDETVPLSLLVALLLNFVATAVNPASVAGPFAGAPFANLTFADKAEVFRRLEEDNTELAALLDGGAPEPMRASVSGEIALLGGVLTAFAVLLSYSEWGVFDRERGVATRRPVGWRISRYAIGRTRPADGWDELKGYYRGYRKTTGGNHA